MEEIVNLDQEEINIYVHMVDDEILFWYNLEVHMVDDCVWITFCCLINCCCILHSFLLNVSNTNYH